MAPLDQPEEFLGGRVHLYAGDCLVVLSSLPPDSVDSAVTDPPYHLTSIVKRFGAENAAPAKVGKTGAYARASAGFMGKTWDGGDIAFRPETWREVWRVLKPGAHLVAFGAPRSYHRMVCAIEDAGFEIRDSLMWIFGSGFPKSHDVSKGIDRESGAIRDIVAEGTPVKRMIPGADQHKGGWKKDNGREFVPQVTRAATPEAAQWEGWGTALKPAFEPIVLARKPLSEDTIAANVLRWGTGALNIDACRIEADGRPHRVIDPKPEANGTVYAGRQNPGTGFDGGSKAIGTTDLGRWPANVVHNGSDEVVDAFPGSSGGHWSGETPSLTGKQRPATIERFDEEQGSAARFFYEVKQDDTCHSTSNASTAAQPLSLKSERAVSVLSHAVEASTARSMLQRQDYRAHDTNVSENELRLIAASVTEVIQNLERRFWLGLPPENTTAKLGPVSCVAIPKPTGITTITISLLRSGHFVEVVTFGTTATNAEVGDVGSARRFWYSSKADDGDRLGSGHPTVKPVDLLQYLIRLVTPPRGIVLDCFAGTGTTAEAAYRESASALLIEAEPQYCDDIRRRMRLVLAGPDERRYATAAEKNKRQPPPPLPLFAE